MCKRLCKGVLEGALVGVCEERRGRRCMRECMFDGR